MSSQNNPRAYREHFDTAFHRTEALQIAKARLGDAAFDRGIPSQKFDLRFLVNGELGEKTKIDAQQIDDVLEKIILLEYGTFEAFLIASEQWEQDIRRRMLESQIEEYDSEIENIEGKVKKLVALLGKAIRETAAIGVDFEETDALIRGLKESKEVIVTLRKECAQTLDEILGALGMPKRQDESTHNGTSETKNVPLPLKNVRRAMEYIRNALDIVLSILTSEAQRNADALEKDRQDLESSLQGLMNLQQGRLERKSGTMFLQPESVAILFRAMTENVGVTDTMDEFIQRIRDEIVKISEIAESEAAL